MKYNELRQTLSDTATDSDDNNGGFHFSHSHGTDFPSIDTSVQMPHNTLFLIFFRCDSVM